MANKLNYLKDWDETALTLDTLTALCNRFEDMSIFPLIYTLEDTMIAIMRRKHPDSIDFSYERLDSIRKEVHEMDGYMDIPQSEVDRFDEMSDSIVFSRK